MITEVTMKFGDDEIRLTDLEEILQFYDLKEGQAQFIPYRLPHRVLSYLESGAFSLTIKAFDSQKVQTELILLLELCKAYLLTSRI